MKDEIERRAADLEVRAKGRILEGYAAVFGVRAKVADFEEMIQPGAFAATLADQTDKLALVDHAPNQLLARTRNKTLELSEDTRGLHFRIALPKTTLADDMLALAEAGSLGGASFGFRATKDIWTRGATLLRTLHSVALAEISIVHAFPAYPQTSVSARALGQVVDTPLARRIRLLELEGGL